MNRTSYEKPAVRRVIPLSELGKEAARPIHPTSPNADGPQATKARTEGSEMVTFGPRFRSLDPRVPQFREPPAGEWIVGLYRSDDGLWFPVLLWADPKVDLFWDPSRLEHVKPPGSYLMLEEQPKIDGESGYPIKGGVVSPF